MVRARSITRWEIAAADAQVAGVDAKRSTRAPDLPAVAAGPPSGRRSAPGGRVGVARLDHQSLSRGDLVPVEPVQLRDLGGCDPVAGRRCG